MKRRVRAEPDSEDAAVVREEARQGTAERQEGTHLKYNELG